MSPTRCWVVGASGLLGAGVARSARRAGWTVVTSSVPWDSPRRAIEVLAHDAGEFLDEAADGPWVLAWCAGAGVVGTGQDVLEDELAVLSEFLTSFAALVESRDASAGGGLFYTSSAGGVYAGSTGAPFTESTSPAPLAPYGEFKLRGEAAVADFSARSGLPVLVGRISNLFGPGQDLRKPQGLISQVGRSCLTRQPISLYVSLDTMRDYLFVDDCADVIVRGMERTLRRAPTTDAVVTKILASGRSTTIAAILGEYQRVFKRPAPVTLASSPAGRFQVRDLRLRSTVWSDLDAVVRTTLGAGIAATVRDVSHQLHGAPTSRAV